MSPHAQRTVFPLLVLALAVVGACSAEQHDAGPRGTSTAGSAGGLAGASGAAQAGAGGTQSEAGTSAAGGGGAPAADWKAPCKERPGPAMVRVPAPDGSTYCIDTTEVTMAHYAAFLAEKKDDLSGQREICKDNTSFEPPGESDTAIIHCPNGYFQPEKTPKKAMGCVDFCDADAYCKWAGKRLCGRIGGGAILTADESIDPKVSEWVNACTQGGKTKLPYGDTFEDGRCLDSTLVPDGVANKEAAQAALADPIKAAPNCHGTEPPFDKIYSMSVGMREWDDSVVGDNADSATSGARGGNYSWSSKAAVPLACAEPDGTQGRILFRYVSTSLGFRCCGDLATRICPPLPLPGLPSGGCQARG